MSKISVNLVWYYSIHDQTFRNLWLGLAFFVTSGVFRCLYWLFRRFYAFYLGISGLVMVFCSSWPCFQTVLRCFVPFRVDLSRFGRFFITYGFCRDVLFFGRVFRRWCGAFDVAEVVVLLRWLIGSDFCEFHCLSFGYKVGFFLVFGARKTQLRELFSTLWSGLSMTTVLPLLSTLTTS